MTYELVMVEDDPIFIFLLEKAIKGVGLQGNIRPYSNGLEALNYFKKNYTKEQNYVVFLDLNMPVMDGFEFMKAFEDLASISNTLVFILTSSRNQKDMDSFEGNPFITEYISKPISEAIIKNLKEIIEDKFG